MSQFKRKLSAFTALLALLSFSSVSQTAHAFSSVDVINKTGNASVIDGNNRTDINVTGGKAGSVAQIDASRYNVGKDEINNFGFSNISQTMILRILGGEQSNIKGHLTNSCVTGSSCTNYAETGKVILINPAGVIFGTGSTVDLNSFTVSTFDIKDAKNLRNMDETALKNYQDELFVKMSPFADTENYVGAVTFDSTFTKAFVEEMGEDKFGQLAGKGTISLDGAKFASFLKTGVDADKHAVYDFEQMNDFTQNKSLNFVADNINYKDSLIRTGSNHNYITSANDRSMGNVRFVTSDGATFEYLANGYTDDYQIADAQSNTARSITIDNAGLADNEVAIQTGDFRVFNNSKGNPVDGARADGKNASSIKISNTIIKGTKLVNNEYGDILIKGVGDVDIDIENSRIETVNTSIDEKDINTNNREGGRIYVYSDGDLNVNNSLIITAGAEGEEVNKGTSGSVRLYSYGGDTNITDSKVLAKGDVRVESYDNTSIDGSVLQARNTMDKSKTKNVTIKSGAETINISDSIVDASGDVNIVSEYSNGLLGGEINISSKPVNGQNQTFIIADNNLNIKSSETTIDNAALAYKNISFYGGENSGLSNVTIKNDTTFSPRNSEGNIGSTISLETNGDFTLDNASMKRATYDVTFTKVGDTDELVDSGVRTPDAVSHTTATASANARYIDVTSTEGDVKVTNGSKIATTATGTSAQTITLNANEGSVIVDKNSKLQTRDMTINAAQDAIVDNASIIASNDVNIDAGNVKLQNGAVVDATNELIANAEQNVSMSGKSQAKAGLNVKMTAKGGKMTVYENSSIEAARGDVELTAHDSITFSNQAGTDGHIDESTTIKAAKGMTIKSTAGDISGKKDEMANMTYGTRLAFNAAGSNKFSSDDTFKTLNVDYIAGVSNEITAADDIQLVDTTFTSPLNKIETTQQGGDVILNNVTLNAYDPEHPELTRTEVIAKGNITTKDAMNTVFNDRREQVHTYIRDVQIDEDGFTMDDESTALNVNGTKFVATAEVVKDASNPDYGSITIDVRGANNRKAGIELTAQNVNEKGEWAYDEKITSSEGPEVVVNAVDDELAISKIITDKLTLDADDTLIAAAADLTDEQMAKLPEGTPKAGYIEVRDKGGFNLDRATDYDGKQTGFEYKENVDKVIVDKDVDETKVVETWDDDVYDYEKTTTTTTTTTTTDDKKHTVEFGKDGNKENFILVYDKTTVDVDTKTDTKTVQTPKDCTPLPEVKPGGNSIDDKTIENTNLPMQSTEVSKDAPTVDGSGDHAAMYTAFAGEIITDGSEAVDSGTLDPNGANVNSDTSANNDKDEDKEDGSEG